MRIRPEVDGASIVLIGAFNPRIFQPEWFRANGIIGDKDADAANVQIIHQSIAAFSLDWTNVRVEPNRFSIDTNDPPLIRIYDVVLKVFKEFLMHTPIHQFGINRLVHFDTGRLETRNRMGELLAPPKHWGEWASKITYDPASRGRGGMRSLSMMQFPREDAFEGSITAKIEPSSIPSLDLRGVYMEINDHFVVGKDGEILNSDPAMEILENQWSTSLVRSEWIIDQIMVLAESLK